MTSVTTSLATATPITANLIARSPDQVRRSFAPTILLTLLLIASAYLRFTGLDRESRWCDEYHQTGSYSMSPWYVVLAARDAAQPPLDYLLGWAIHKIDPSLWAMRAPAAAFGIVSIALTYLLVRRFTNWTTGLIAAGLVAFSPFHFQMSQTARPYTIFVTTLLLMIWTLIAALDRPDWRRLLVCGGTATLMTLTRGMAAPVILLSTAIVLSAFALFVRDPQTRIGLRRTCLVTVIVGMLAAGMTAFLIGADQSWSILGAAGTTGLEGPSASRVSRLIDNLRCWIDAPSLFFATASAFVLLFAGIGAAFVIAGWRRISIQGRLIVSLLAIAGPMFVVIYTLAVRQWPLAPRYAFFLLPLVAALAGIGIVTLTGALVRRLGGDRPTAQWTGLLSGLLLISVPAHATIIQSRSYSNPDWRGCAAYLEDRVAANDVIMVIQDRPLGEYQSTFWGKYEWPRGFDAPLAEAAHTFVTSPSHWERLLRQTGRCYLVVHHQVAGETSNAYLGAGMQTAPTGTILTKFRGLDLLERRNSDRGLAAVAEACRISLAVPMAHESVWTIPKALITKIERELTGP